MAEQKTEVVNEIVAGWVDEPFDTKARAKNYALVVYPDDMPEDWLEIMQESMYDMVISPYHDKDTNPDGTVKKPHYHILVSAGRSWIPYSQLVEWGRKLRGVAKPQKASNPKGLVRYFTHMDNPEKFQYARSEIRIVGNYDIEPFFRATQAQEREIRREIMRYVMEEDIREFATLAEYCFLYNDEWDDYLSRNAYYIKEYISSRRFRARDYERAIADGIENNGSHSLAKELIENDVKRLGFKSSKAKDEARDDSWLDDVVVSD